MADDLLEKLERIQRQRMGLGPRPDGSIGNRSWRDMIKSMAGAYMKMPEGLRSPGEGYEPKGPLMAEPESFTRDMMRQQDILRGEGGADFVDGGEGLDRLQARSGTWGPPEGLSPRNPVGVAAQPSSPPGQSIRGRLSAYSPQAGGGRMEGGYASSRRGPDGKATVRTIDDYVSGRSSYVTAAGNPSEYGSKYTASKLPYYDARTGQTSTLENVPFEVHDTGSAFRNAPQGRLDIAIGRDLGNDAMARNHALWRSQGVDLQSGPAGQGVTMAATGSGPPQPINVADAGGPQGAFERTVELPTLRDTGPTETVKARVVGYPVGGTQAGKDFSDVPRHGGAPFSRDFGGPRGGGRHAGLDVPGAVGDPVYAPEGGRIMSMTQGQGYGNMVDVRTPGGGVHRFGHLNSFKPGLSVGDTVGAGNEIGSVGYTGNAGPEFPHLHMETFPDMQAYNAAQGQSSRAAWDLRSDPRQLAALGEPPAVSGGTQMATVSPSQPAPGAQQLAPNTTPPPSVQSRGVTQFAGMTPPPSAIGSSPPSFGVATGPSGPSETARGAFAPAPTPAISNMQSAGVLPPPSVTAPSGPPPTQTPVAGSPEAAKMAPPPSQIAGVNATPPSVGASPGGMGSASPVGPPSASPQGAFQMAQAQSLPPMESAKSVGVTAGAAPPTPPTPTPPPDMGSVGGLFGVQTTGPTPAPPVAPPMPAVTPPAAGGFSVAGLGGGGGGGIGGALGGIGSAIAGVMQQQQQMAKATQEHNTKVHEDAMKATEQMSQWAQHDQAARAAQAKKIAEYYQQLNRMKMLGLA